MILFQPNPLERRDTTARGKVIRQISCINVKIPYFNREMFNSGIQHLGGSSNCDNIPDMAGPHILNSLYQPMSIRKSCGFSHLLPGAFHMFYKYTTDITYITASGRKKNKHRLS